MEHPFISDLSALKVEELQIKMSELTRKLNFAYQRQNSAMIHQINMALESYRNAYQKKMDEQFAKQNIGASIKINEGHQSS